MIGFLLKYFNKNTCPAKFNGKIIINDVIFPYENLLFRRSAKGNFYIRKTIYTYKYVNPLLGKKCKTKYSGILHVVIEDEFNGRTEKQYTIKTDYFDGDQDFLNDAYIKYPI